MSLLCASSPSTGHSTRLKIKKEQGGIYHQAIIAMILRDE
jgi:hypothetical protein